MIEALAVGARFDASHLQTVVNDAYGSLIRKAQRWLDSNCAAQLSFDNSTEYMDLAQDAADDPRRSRCSIDTIGAEQGSRDAASM